MKITYRPLIEVKMFLKSQKGQQFLMNFFAYFDDYKCYKSQTLAIT